MIIDLSAGKAIHELQQEFNTQYPFLKLEFYKIQQGASALPGRKHLDHSALLKTAGLKKAGRLVVKEEMTVGELEKELLGQFGLDVQVSRKSGSLWLQTTMTDSWTLRKQNEHGREISLSSHEWSVPEAPEEGDWQEQA